MNILIRRDVINHTSTHGFMKGLNGIFKIFVYIK